MNKERIREVFKTAPTPEYMQSKLEEGWRPVAIEWERETSHGAPGGALRHEVPYGLRVSEDCHQLEDDSKEKEVMKLMLALIAGDHPLSKIAEELNARGHFMRDGKPWSQVKVFNMLPRLIEMAPEILSADEWSTNRDRILEAV
jgi:hypothetical protein